jgi:hypothetical protein
MRRLIVGLVVALTAGLVTVPFTTAASATAGAPDPTFNGGEPLVFLAGSNHVTVIDAVLLSDGTTFVAGMARDPGPLAPVVMRISSSGVVASVQEVVVPAESPNVTDVILDSSGKPLLLGSASGEVFVTRYLASGAAPDPTFGGGGTVLMPGIHAGALAVDDDEIVVALNDSESGHLVRIDAEGAVLSSSAMVSEPGEYLLGLLLDDEGRAYLRVADTGGVSLRRVLVDGSVDDTFGDVTIENNSSFALHGDCVLVGGMNGDTRAWTVTRLLETGAVDPTFGIDGTSSDLEPYGAQRISVDDDGRVLVSGGAPDGISLVRLTPDGVPDATFGLDGSITFAGLAGAPRTIIATTETITLVGRTFEAGEPAGFAARVVTATTEPEPTTTTTSSTTTSTTTTTTTTTTTLPASGGGGGGAPAPVAVTTTTTVAPTTTTTTPAPSSSPAASEGGYWLGEHGGTLHAFGDAAEMPAADLTVVDITATPDGRGVWAVDAAGRVRARGTAPNLDDAPTMRLFEVIVSISPTPTGRGYWLFTNHGRAFDYGDAGWFGDMSKQRLNAPIVDSSATPDGKGYYLIGADGGVFTYGNARFLGSTGDLKLNEPVRALVPTTTGGGYWLVASDGGVFNFGDARFRGSMGATRLNAPVVGMVTYGDGYLMVASDGGVFTFSNRPFSGSLGSKPPFTPIVAITALP